MKKICLLVSLLMVLTIAQSQQNTTVLQPDSVFCQEMVHDGGLVYNPYNSTGAFSYNNDGTLAQILNSCDHPDYWGNRYWDFEYDYHYNLIGYKQATYAAGYGTYLYDVLYDGDNVIDIKKTYDDLHGYNWSYEKSTYYDGNNRVAENSIVHDNGTGTKTIMCRDRYEYNDNEIVRTQQSFSTTMPTARITTTLALDGKTLSVKSEEMTNGIFVNTEYTEYHYDNGFLASAETSHWDGEWIPYSKDIYSRNSDGAIITAEHKLWNTTDYENHKRTLYEYNEAGYPLSIHYQDFDDITGSWVDGECYYESRYDYILSSVWTADPIFTQDHLRYIDIFMRNGRRYFGRIEFTYTETANPHYGIVETNDIPVTIYPNPTTGMVTIDGESLRSVEVVNIIGKTIIKNNCYGNKVSVSIAELPAGIYFFNITDKQGNKCTRKIVKE